MATLFGGRVLQRRSWPGGASIVSSVCSHTCLVIRLDLACMPFKVQRDPTLSSKPAYRHLSLNTLAQFSSDIGSDVEKVSNADEDGVYVHRTQWGFCSICIRTCPG